MHSILSLSALLTSRVPHTALCQQRWLCWWVRSPATRPLLHYQLFFFVFSLHTRRNKAAKKLRFHFCGKGRPFFLHFPPVSGSIPIAAELEWRLFCTHTHTQLEDLRNKPRKRKNSHGNYDLSIALSSSLWFCSFIHTGWYSLLLLQNFPLSTFSALTRPSQFPPTPSGIFISLLQSCYSSVSTLSF